MFVAELLLTLTRPALPALCAALAFDTHTSTSDDMWLVGSYLFSFTLPVSITWVMSSMVMLVSAILVAATTWMSRGERRREEGGGHKTRAYI